MCANARGARITDGRAIEFTLSLLKSASRPQNCNSWFREKPANPAQPVCPHSRTFFELASTGNGLLPQHHHLTSPARLNLLLEWTPRYQPRNLLVLLAPR